MRLILMRHGQTGSNERGALDTALPGAVLTELGVRQAAAAVPHLLRRGVAAAYASDLTRARQTASALADRLGEPSVVSGLREIGAGELEMRSDPDAVRGYAHAVLSWLGGELGERIPGGEDGHEFLSRYDEAVRSLAEGADTGGHPAVVAVSHGAAIGAWAHSRARNVSTWGPTPRLRNTGIVVLEGDPEDGWVITEWSSDPLGGAHLDAPDPYAMHR